MNDRDRSFPSDEDIEAFLAPIVLSEPSGEWIASRRALGMVQNACSVDQTDARRALCRRAVAVVPVNCASWSVRVGPVIGDGFIDFSPPTKRDNQHFKQTMDRQSFSEILIFFEALEHGSDRKGHWTIEHANWATGDFKVHLDNDARTISLSVIGLQFDRLAVESVFSEAPSGVAKEVETVERAQTGRPRSAAWADWIAELSSFIHERGFPEGSGSQGQEALISGIADRLAERGLEGPSRSTVQSVVQAVLDRHRDEKS